MSRSENPKATLDIRDLTVAYQEQGELVDAVRDVSLQILPGQVYGLVGESGSGKSTLALAIMRYLSEDGVIRRGSILLGDHELTQLNTRSLREVWGSQIALVPQDPLSALNPAIQVGEQIAESLGHNLGMSSLEAEKRTLKLLEDVHISDPARVAKSFPHRISGGMQQRVMIAMALGGEPSLLVLDEPTTGLDVTTEAVILDLFRELVRSQKTSTLYVSHNMGVVAQFADRVAILYASELVEDAATVDLYKTPLHPYTQGLLDSVPRLGENKSEVQLRAIKGQIPSLGDLPQGCVFTPRCPLAIDICHEERPQLERPSPDRLVRCHRWPEILAGEVETGNGVSDKSQERSHSDEIFLETDDAKVHYPVRRSLREMLGGAPPKQVKALDGVSLQIRKGDTLGVVGESGSGKTTLARALVGLVDHREGAIELLGVQLPARVNERTREMKQRLQMIFQNPQEALNPYLTVEESLSRPFVRLLRMSRQEASLQAAELLEAVRLSPEYLSRFPRQLSGGERQRVAMARAFAAQPGLLIADEPVSSLDVSVQAAILNLFNDLQIERGTSLLFISHDLTVVGYLADEVAVMYLGKLMEVSGARGVFDPPYHPYTEALLSAVPLIDPEASQEQIRLKGQVPSAIDVPSGCPFHTRCPRFLGDICVEERPPWRGEPGGKQIYCHIPTEELRREQKAAFRIGKRKE